MEHAYRQSMPDSYGVGLGMMGGMGGGMGINNLPGAGTLLYGRGMGYGGVSIASGSWDEFQLKTRSSGLVCLRRSLLC